MIKNITRVLGHLSNVTVKLLCLLNDTRPQENSKYKKKSFSKWITGSGINKESAYTYDYATFLILDFNNKAEGYDPKRFIMIPLFQLHQLSKFLKDCLDLINSDRTFYYSDKEETQLKIYAEAASRICQSNMFIRSTMLMGRLTVIQYNEEQDYEGIRIIVNNKDNFFELYYTELEELIYFIDKTDFAVLSQSLVNSSILWISKNLSDELRLNLWSKDVINDSHIRSEREEINRINSTTSGAAKRVNVFSGLNTNEIITK